MFMWSTLVVYSKVIYALALIISTTPIQPKTCIKVAQVLWIGQAFGGLAACLGLWFRFISIIVPII